MSCYVRIKDKCRKGLENLWPVSNNAEFYNVFLIIMAVANSYWYVTYVAT